MTKSTGAFSSIDILEAIPALRGMDEKEKYENSYCCLTCRKELIRVDVRVGERIFRPLPVCQCEIKRQEDAREKREREYRKMQIANVFSKHLMSDQLKNASFDNFTHRDGTETALRASKSLVQSFETAKQGIYMFGQVGCGKSHLARAIQREVDSQGHATLFLDFPQLIVIAKETMNRTAKFSLADIIKAAIQVDLLVIDEIGVGQLTEFEFTDVLFPIINGRQGKVTVYTSNLDLKRLSDWFAVDKYGKPIDPDGRMVDRLLASVKIIKNTATSKRREDAMRGI